MNNLIWREKKRIVGFPISFTSYGLSIDRLFVDSGIFLRKSDEILLYRIRDLSVSISLYQRFLGIGTIHVTSVDASIPNLDLINIPAAKFVKELIHKHVEKNKQSRRMVVGEVIEPSSMM